MSVTVFHAAQFGNPLAISECQLNAFAQVLLILYQVLTHFSEQFLTSTNSFYRKVEMNTRQ